MDEILESKYTYFRHHTQSHSSVFSPFLIYKTTHLSVQCILYRTYAQKKHCFHFLEWRQIEESHFFCFLLPFMQHDNLFHVLLEIVVTQFCGKYFMRHGCSWLVLWHVTKVEVKGCYVTGIFPLGSNPTFNRCFNQPVRVSFLESTTCLWK